VKMETPGRRIAPDAPDRALMAVMRKGTHDLGAIPA